MDVRPKTPVLEAALETLIDSAVVIDAAGVILIANEAVAKMFQYRLDNLLGENVSILMPEPYRSHHNSYIQNYHKTGIAKIIKIGREVEGLRSDGTQFPMHLAVGEMQIEGKRHYLGVMQDLTEVKAKQAAFDDLQNQHFHLSRVAAMNEMGAAIAHEINQPLAAAANYLETAKILLGRMNAEKCSDDLNKISDLISKSGEQNIRASEIIARLRRFIERGDSQSEVFNLKTILDDAIELTIPKAKRTEIDIHVNIQERATWVHADPIQIQQVIMNLLRNAVEAMGGSSKKRLVISIETDAQTPKFVKVQISDSGKGISDDIYSDLFTPFSSSKKRGLGVGLSISRSIISAAGGNIDARDNPDSGTILSFTLPIADKL